MHLATHYQEIRSDRNNPYLLRFLFTLFCTLILTRFVVNANVLDSVMKYSAEGGSIVEKLHPSTYGLIVLLLTALLCLRVELVDWELRALRSLIAFVAIIISIAAFLGFVGHSGSIGYLVDLYVVACVAGAVMLAFPPAWRETIGATLIIFLAISSCVALGEFALQKRLLPYWATELSFRPTGLTEHPLQLGLFNATAINLVPLTRWKAASKVGVTIILLLGVFAAGARLASIVAVGSTFLVVVLAEWPSLSSSRRSQLKLALIIGGMLALPILLTMLIQMGLVDRFQQGLFDESAMARVSIYRLFDMVSWSEILLGADIGRIRALAFDYLDLDYIESSLVMFIFQFGLFGTLIFLVSLARTFFVLLSGADRRLTLGACAFFVVASSNNALSSKTPIILMIVLLLIAFHGGSRARPAARQKPVFMPSARSDTGSSALAPSLSTSAIPPYPDSAQSAQPKPRRSASTRTSRIHASWDMGSEAR